MTPVEHEPSLREARDDDQAGLIDLIGGVFAEYPGCVLDVDGELPELRRIASYFAEQAGRFWVAEYHGRIAGCIGLTPSAEAGAVELKKLYVAEPARCRGLGARLCELVEAEAVRRRARFIDLWSDTRFETAHHFYLKRGYVRGEQIRELYDQSKSVEYYFRKQLGRAS